MLIKFSEIVNRYGIKPKGILHVGAHMCEEMPAYTSHGVQDIVWIEANPKIVERLKHPVEGLPRQKIIQGLVSDVAGQKQKFYITNNGESSSMLPFGTHATHHPTVVVTEITELTTTTLSDIYSKNNIDGAKYDFLNMDIQGAELKALRGLGDRIKYFKYIYLEVNTEEVYVGCAILRDLNEFLWNHGFRLRDIKMTMCGWGDALYVKET